ncbi:MAG: hypothetical protein ACOYLH_05055 [Flavobacteriales bacterium]
MKNRRLKPLIIVVVIVLIVFTTRVVFFRHQPIADRPFLSMENVSTWTDVYGQSVDSLIRLHDKNVFIYLTDSAVVDTHLGEKISVFARSAEQAGWGVQGFSIYDYNQNENLRHGYQWAFPLHYLPEQNWENLENKGVHLAAYFHGSSGQLYDFTNCPEFADWSDDLE